MKINNATKKLDGILVSIREEFESIIEQSMRINKKTMWSSVNGFKHSVLFLGLSIDFRKGPYRDNMILSIGEMVSFDIGSSISVRLSPPDGFWEEIVLDPTKNRAIEEKIRSALGEKGFEHIIAAVDRIYREIVIPYGERWREEVRRNNKEGLETIGLMMKNLAEGNFSEKNIRFL